MDTTGMTGTACRKMFKTTLEAMTIEPAYDQERLLKSLRATFEDFGQPPIVASDLVFIDIHDLTRC